jgi:hypothetical protein
MENGADSGSATTAGGRSKKFLIKTFGCQMNAADSERMASLLSDQGMGPTEEVEDADVIIINGCTVREKAVHKAVSALGRFQKLKKPGGFGPLIGIGGCVGQLDKGSLFANAPYLDFVFGTDTIDNLPEIIDRVRNGERHVVYADFDKSMDYSTETKVFGAKAQAFVNIMKGCDKYCTYCIVPYTRGREKSRTIDEVVSDIARLVATGVKEVTLLGQNVNSFGKGNPNVKQREPQELHNKIGKVGPRAGEENFPQLLRAIDQDPRCAGKVVLPSLRVTCIFLFKAAQTVFCRRWGATTLLKAISRRWIACLNLIRTLGSQQISLLDSLRKPKKTSSKRCVSLSACLLTISTPLPIRHVQERALQRWKTMCQQR